MWAGLTAVAVRQCESDTLRGSVRELSERVRALEDRPTLKITVDDEPNVEVFDGDD